MVLLVYAINPTSLGRGVALRAPIPSKGIEALNQGLAAARQSPVSFREINNSKNQPEV